MQKNKILQIFLLVFFVLVIVILLIIQVPDKNLHIYFLSVGQGDSIYVRTMNNRDILIDGGSDNKVLSELGSVMPFWDHKIDYVILTHPHADHLTGLISVLKRYQIGEIISNDAITTTSEYLEWLKLIKEKNISLHIIKSTESIDVDRKTKLDFFWPLESYKDKKVENLNNTSIVFKLVYDKFSSLFTGDLEMDAQQQLSTNNLQLTTNIWKVSHHGSKNGINDNFLKIINPDIAVIEVGEKNKYGHPASSTLYKLTSIGAKIFRTDQNGRIEITTDGQRFWTKSEK